MPHSVNCLSPANRIPNSTIPELDLLIKLEKQRKRIEYLEGELREATLQNSSRLIDEMTYFV